MQRSVPDALRGTYLGLASEPAIQHLVQALLECADALVELRGGERGRDIGLRCGRRPPWFV